MARLKDLFQETIQLNRSDEDLIRVYTHTGRSVDELAYTPDFEKLYEQYSHAGHGGEKQDVFRRLLLLRKAGLLPRFFTSTPSPND